MKTTENIVENAVWQWLDEVVIGQNFCPFANAPRKQNTIRLEVFTGNTNKEIINSLAHNVATLDNNTSLETTLIVLTNMCSNFTDYLDTVAICENALIDLGYEGVYQLATFHPQYVFQDATNNCASNYTNRAPYPILHILREQSVERVLSFTDKPENIYKRNIEHAKKLGQEFFLKYMK